MNEVEPCRLGPKHMPLVGFVHFQPAEIIRPQGKRTGIPLLGHTPWAELSWQAGLPTALRSILASTASSHSKMRLWSTMDQV